MLEWLGLPVIADGLQLEAFVEVRSESKWLVMLATSQWLAERLQVRSVRLNLETFFFARVDLQ